MMRLLRASVIVALSLLAWAATASAECAWVLWRQEELNARPGVAGEIKWATPDAYSGRAACVAEMETYVKSWEDLGRTLAKQPDKDVLTVKRWPSGTAVDLMATFTKYNAWNLTLLRCLPDTVNPRGLEGK